MALVNLDNSEFPPLDQTSQSTPKAKRRNIISSNSHFNQAFNDNLPIDRNNLTSTQDSPRSGSSTDSRTPDFIPIGIQLNRYHEDLKHILGSISANFIVAPIEPLREGFYGKRFHGVPDLVISSDDWSRVYLDLGYPTLDQYDIGSTRHFQQLFDYALYLRSPVIIIDCPESDLSCITLASIINNYTKQARGVRTDPTILIRISMTDNSGCVLPKTWINETSDKPVLDSTESGYKSPEPVKRPRSPKIQKCGYSPTDPNFSSNWNNESSGCLDYSDSESAEARSISWNYWNNLRSYLNPYSKIGVCLNINDDVPSDPEETARWAGEPIRAIEIHTDRFVGSPTLNNAVRLNGRMKEFVRQILLKNSLKPSLILRGSSELASLRKYTEFLYNYACGLIQLNQDYLRDYNDKMRYPMQPLSTNLDSGTYGTFERDTMKYVKYKDAMVEALRYLTSKKKQENPYILMVLGAGRGPLVDCFISAIKSLHEKYKFKVYALDKNYCSVVSLKYKQQNNWADDKKYIETEVVECDMRTWDPKIKADIIATELLGSFADNELSPECLDGVWRLSNPETISIPQSYASHIGPICSFKAQQVLYNSFEEQPHDRIWVCKLTNFYPISEPQKLFEFQHNDLSSPPIPNQNERYSRLVFHSKIDTVCHGFAGYFSAELFGQVSIATVPTQKTPNMDSWWPVYIPLEHPIQMPKGTKLVLHFWRMESPTHAWYQWAISEPVKTRIYSPNGFRTAMSKST